MLVQMIRVAKLISHMKKSPAWEKSHIFFITQPPFPEMKSKGKRNNCENNFNAGLGAAFDKAVMETAGVTVIDAYSLLVSRNDDGVNFDHYMTTLNRTADSLIEKGHEGMLIVHKLLQHLCGPSLFEHIEYPSRGV